jgi:flagellar export protein FliJ
MAKFRLAPVLTLRKHREDDRKRELAEALAEESREKQSALRFAEMRQDQATLLRQRQAAGEIDVRTLIEDRTYLGQLDREIQRQLRVVARCELETNRRRAVLVEARRDRRAMEVLQEKFLAARRAVEVRRETAELDEVAIRLAGHGRSAEA